MAEETPGQSAGTVTVEGANAIKARLESVNDELKRIETTVKRDAESLDRLKQLLDSTYVQKLLAAIEELEARITAAGTDAVAAHKEAESARSRLLVEEERLEKLWDAYRVQETELREAEARAARLEAELRAKDAAASAAEEVVKAREAEINRLARDNESLRSRVTDLESARAELADLAALKERLAEAEAAYAAEKERLAKLFIVYEELAEDNQKLEREVKERDAWIQKNVETFDAMNKNMRRRPDTPAESEGKNGNA